MLMGRRGKVRRGSFENCIHTGSNNHIKSNICITLVNLKIALMCMSAFDHNPMKLSWGREAIYYPQFMY